MRTSRLWLSIGLVVIWACQVKAETLTWTGTSGSATNWSDSSKWTPGTYPQAGDLAQLQVAITNWTYLDIQGGASVGSLYVKTSWGQYRIKTSWGGTKTFNFNNSGNDSVVTVTHNSSGYTGLIQFGADANAINVNLANNLMIQDDAARTSHHGQVALGSYSTLVGGSVNDRRTVTIRTVGTGTSKATLTINGSATFVGDWVVETAKATLDMNANSFGDATNTVTLVNGGMLDLLGLGSFTWTRSLSGTGTVKTTGLTVGSGGSFNIAGVGAAVDALSVVGSLTLGAGSVLNVTGEIDSGDYVIVTSDTGITGTFATANLGDGMSLTYGANSITLHVVNGPGIGVYLNHGDEAEIEDYEDWLGRPLDCIVDFTPIDTWVHLAGTSPGVGLAWWVYQWDASYRDRIVISTGMLPKSGGSLTAGANGDYDQYWVAYATKLVSYGYTDNVIRLGWEFNAGWYNWSAKNNPTAFKQYWIRIVNAINSVQGTNFRFNWCGTVGDQGMNPADAYPGDAYVDEIGCDIYDQSWHPNAYPYQPDDEPWEILWRQTNAWNSLVNWGNYHLNWWSDFSVSHNKPFTIPEWGLADRPSDDHGGLDNPSFITRMYNWISNPDNNVSWHSYFQENNSEIRSKIFEDDQFPNATDVFLDLFGGD